MLRAMQIGFNGLNNKYDELSFLIKKTYSMETQAYLD